MKWVTHLLITITLGQFALPAAAQKLDAPSSAHVSFDPFSGLSATATVRLSVTSGEEEQLRSIIRLRLADGQPWQVGPDGPRFLLRSAQGESSGPVLDLSVIARPDAMAAVDLDLVVPAGQFAAAGSYDAELEATLLDAAGNPLDSPRFLRIAVTVPARAQANIAGSSGSFGSVSALAMLDFGELESGESLDAFLQVRANAPATITATSDNGGQLLNIDSPSAPGIDYQLQIDGSRAFLASPLVLHRLPPPTLDGISYRVRVTILNAHGAFAGRYRDVLTIDVDAQ